MGDYAVTQVSDVKQVYWSTWLGDGGAAYSTSEWCEATKATLARGACKAVVVIPLR